MNKIDRRIFTGSGSPRLTGWFAICLPIVFIIFLLAASGAYAELDCTDCHVSMPHGMDCDSTACTVCHANKLEGSKHPSGKGTPFDSDLMNTNGVTYPCITCHVAPGAKHPFRINTDPNIFTGDTNLEYACGQCHGGSGGWAATKPGVPFMDLDQLSAYAKGLHAYSSSAPTVGTANFAISGFTVTFDDASSGGNHEPAGTLNITVKWGDGTVSSGIGGTTFTHIYASAATYSIMHTASSNNLFDSETLTAKVPSASVFGGEVTVQVNNYLGAGLADVSLYLKRNGVTKKSSSTGSSGGFVFQDVPPGVYDVIAYKYGVQFDGEDGMKSVTVDSVTPDPVVNFTEIQTRFTLTVNGSDDYVVTVSQAGVTRGIAKISGGRAVFGNLGQGSYDISGYAVGFDCEPTAGNPVAVDPGTGDVDVTLRCSAR